MAMRKSTRIRHQAALLNTHGSGYTVTPHNLIGSVYKFTLRLNGNVVGRFYTEDEAYEAIPKKRK